MSAKTIIFFIFTIFLLFSSIHGKSLSIEDRRQIARHCVKTTGINPTTLANIIDTKSVPRGGMYGDYLVCTYSLQGFLNPKTSELGRKKISGFLADYYSSSEVSFIMEGCKNVKNPIPRELALDALDCFTQQFDIVDSLRQTGNEIDGNIDGTSAVNPLKH